MFNEQYGPFDPICTGDRFVRVDSGDSIEVFGMKALSVGLTSCRGPGPDC
jgi:hypothetical protein